MSCAIQQRFFCGRGSHLHCVEFQCHFELGFILSASLIMIAQALGSPRFPKHVVMDPQAMEGCRSLHRSGILSGIACGPCFFPALCFQTLNFFATSWTPIIELSPSDSKTSLLQRNIFVRSQDTKSLVGRSNLKWLES